MSSSPTIDTRSRAGKFEPGDRVVVAGNIYDDVSDSYGEPTAMAGHYGKVTTTDLYISVLLSGATHDNPCHVRDDSWTFVPEELIHAD